MMNKEAMFYEEKDGLIKEVFKSYLLGKFDSRRN